MTQESLIRRAVGRSADSRPPGLRGRYGLLLLLLITTYLLSAFSFIALAEPLQVALFAAVLLLALRTSPLDRRLAEAGRRGDADRIGGSPGGGADPDQPVTAWPSSGRA